jgi:cytochrome P450
MMVGRRLPQFDGVAFRIMDAAEAAEQAKPHAELDAVLGGRTPTQQDLARPPYTRMVIDEAMRLYPPARSVGRSRHDYIPFGGGPRVCIGMSPVLTEASIILATLAPHFRLDLSPDCEVALAPRIAVRPKNPMKMSLHRR